MNRVSLGCLPQAAILSYDHPLLYCWRHTLSSCLTIMLSALSLNRRYVNEGEMLIYGPSTVISQRPSLEAVFAGAGGSKYLDSLGLCDRWTNYTAHPSQTPGRTICFCPYATRAVAWPPWTA